MELTPPSGYTVIPATLRDAGRLADLENAVTIGEVGVAWTNENDMRENLGAADVALENDTALVLDPDGKLVAGLILIGEGTNDALALGLVHPEAWGRGLGTFVTQLGEARARRKLAAAPEGRVTVHGSRFVQNEAAATLFRNLEYDCTRTWWRMTVDLGDTATPTPMPDGIEMRLFEPERDARAVYDALAEAFEDHWGSVMSPWQDWSGGVLEASTAMFILPGWDGDEIAGALVGRVGRGADPAAGMVEEIGVRRCWRGRGLGRALLEAAFREFRARGCARAVLVVDSESPTGATRLYERAGMRVELAWDRWEKELRPGSLRFRGWPP